MNMIEKNMLEDYLRRYSADEDIIKAVAVSRDIECDIYERNKSDYNVDCLRDAIERVMIAAFQAGMKTAYDRY